MEPSNQNHRLMVLGAVTLAAGMACLAAVTYRLAPSVPAVNPTSSPSIGSLQAPIRTLVKPLPPAQGYVGSESCRECHETIYERYSSSPMGQSLAPIDQALQRPGESSGSFHPAGPRHYEIARSEQGMDHIEVMLDDQGETIYAHSEEIAFVLGSGRRGRSYLIHSDGALYQSPIGWYAASQDWDLSPGYEPENHPRFSRLVGDSCLYCHAGRTNSIGVNADRYETTVFSEAAIGCERCHGPGENHIALQESGQQSLDTGFGIVNPAKLTGEASDSICNQCHVFGQSVVLRYGRNFFDFRPGDQLEDVFVILERTNTGAGPQNIRAVSQVEQMRSSVCFTASDGRMKCISCHDPHSTYRGAERHTFYRQRCLSCHQHDSCAEPLAVREAAPANNSCIHCHMPSMPANKVPHTSLTHHGILRRPGEFVLAGRTSGNDDPTGSSMGAGLRVFANGQNKMPHVEVERAKGIAMMAAAWPVQHRQLAAMAMARLLKLVHTNEEPLQELVAEVDDIAFLRELGSGFFLLNQPEFAEVCWQRVHDLAPNDETALLGLAKLFERKRDLVAFHKYLDLLVVASPHSEETWSMRMMAGVFEGDTPLVIESAQRLMKLNPSLVQTHRVLADAYRRSGVPIQAKHHETMIERLTKAMKDPE